MGLLEMIERTPVGHLLDTSRDNDPAAYLKIFERKGDTLHVHAADADATIVATVTFQEPDRFSGICAIVRTSPNKPIASEDRVIATVKLQNNGDHDEFIVFDVNGRDRLGVVRPTTKPGYQYETISEGGETWYIRIGGYTHIPPDTANGDVYVTHKAAQDAAGLGASFLACLAA